MMTNVVYVSKVHLERIKGPLRLARLPGEETPVKFSVHDEIGRASCRERVFGYV